MSIAMPKTKAINALNRIDEILSSYVGGTSTSAHKDRFILWLLMELERIADRHGFRLAGAGPAPGGEGVNDGTLAWNGNQSTPESSKAQCEGKLSDEQREALLKQQQAQVEREKREEDERLALSKDASERARSGLNAGDKWKLVNREKERERRLPCYDPSPVGGKPVVVEVEPLEMPCPAPESIRPVSERVKVRPKGVEAAKVFREEMLAGVKEDGGNLSAVMVKPDWPEEAKLKIEGFCPNPRLMVARLYEEEGGQKFRRVSVWKDRAGRIKPGNVVTCRLDKAGNPPVYLAV